MVHWPNGNFKKVQGWLSTLKKDLKESHGSYQDKSGATAWIIEGKTSQNCIIGTMITPGGPNAQSSFCSELAGLYGIWSTLKVLNILPIPGMSCRIVCNGKSVLDQLKSKHPVLPFKPHADLLQVVQTLATNSAFTIKWHHVPGCQDGWMITALTQDTWMNIEANSLAKTAVNPMHQGPNQFHLPGKGWVCSISSQHIVKQLVSKLREHVNRVPAKKYWKNKFKMLEDVWDSIDWQGLDWAYWELSVSTQRWAVKYTSGFFAHGKNMTQWNFWSVSRFPWYSEVLEGKGHIMQCTSKGAQQIWDQSLKEVKNGLEVVAWCI